MRADSRLALHPQVDLATEPRWPRISGGFGADAELSANIARAYIRGLQGEELSATSVATMTKHFPGGGPQKEGLDPHFEFQQGQIYPGGNFNYHLVPFEAAIDAGTAAIMPYYGIARDQTDENVAMAFNKQIITGLLRDKYNYDGVICTDWGVLTDITVGDGVTWPARAAAKQRRTWLLNWSNPGRYPSKELMFQHGVSCGKNSRWACSITHSLMCHK